MKKITTIEEGVESLFLAGQRPSVPFTYEKAGREDRCDSLILDGERYPVSKGDSYFLPPLRGLAVEGDFMALVSSV